MIRGIASNVDAASVDGDPERLSDALARRVAAGYAGAELAIECFNAVRAGNTVPEEIDRARAVLGRFPLRYTIHGPCGLNLTRHPERASRVMSACLHVAAALGAEVYVYHSGQIALHDAALGLRALPSERELDLLWEAETEALRPHALGARELGVMLTVENRDPHLWEIAALARQGRGAEDLIIYHQGMRLDLLAAQVTALDTSSVGICLDVGHAFLAAPYWPNADYLGGIRAAAPWVRHVHLHDNFGILDDVSESLSERLLLGEADNHLPPGWGCIPLRETMGILDSAEYRGWVVTEIRPRYEAHLADALAGTARCLP